LPAGQLRAVSGHLRSPAATHGVAVTTRSIIPEMRTGWDLPAGDRERRADRHTRPGDAGNGDHRPGRRSRRAAAARRAPARGGAAERAGGIPMSVRSEVERLRRKVRPDGQPADRCPDCPFLIYIPDGRPAPILDCPSCGRPVRLVIREIIVETREDVERVREMEEAARSEWPTR